MSRSIPDGAAGPDDLALLQYTGGTTGRPKGAMLTHGNLLANVEQICAWMRSTLVPGAETVVTALPLYHIFALTANLLVFVKLGGHNVLVPDPRDLRGLVRTLTRTRYTAITGVNTLYKVLLDAPGFTAAVARNAGSLKVAIAGGMALEHDVAERWHTATGGVLTEGYGLTEASPVVCVNRLDAPPYTGKLGLPLPSTEVRIERDDRTPAQFGEPGEPSRRTGRRGGRRAGRAQRGSRRAVCRQARSGADRGSAARALRRPPHRIQATAAHRIPDSAPEGRGR